MPPSWFAACFGHASDDALNALSSADVKRAVKSAVYEDDGILPAKSDSKRSFNILGSGKGGAKGGDVAARVDDADGGGDAASQGLSSSRKLRIISTTSGTSGPLPDSPSAKLRTSKKHLRAHLKQAQPKRSILKRNGTGSLAGGADADPDGPDAAGEVPPWDLVDDSTSAPCSPAGAGAGGSGGFGDGPAYGRNSSNTAMNAWEPSPSRFNGSASRIVPLPATTAMPGGGVLQHGADRRGSGGSWVGGGERPLSPGGAAQLYGSGCDGGTCMVTGAGADEAGPGPAPWLRSGGGGAVGTGDALADGGVCGGLGRQMSSPVPDASPGGSGGGGGGGGLGWAGGLPTPSRLAHSSTAGVAGLDGAAQSAYSGYSSCSGAVAGGGGSRLSSARGGLRGAGVPAVLMPSSGGGGLSGGLFVASATSRAALTHGGGGSRSSQAAHVNEGPPGAQGATAFGVSSLRAGASPIGGGGGGYMSAPVVWSTNELCEPGEFEELHEQPPLQPARAPQQQRSLRADRPAALILPIERPGSGSGRSPAGAAAAAGAGASSGGQRSLRISPAAAAVSGLASCGQDTPLPTPAGAAAAAAFSRRNTNTNTCTTPVPSPAAPAALQGSSRAALAGAGRDEVMRMLAAESPGRSPMWYDHKARELMQAGGAAGDERARGGGAWQQLPQPSSPPGDARLQPQSISTFRQLAATTGCDDPDAAAVGADAVPLSAPAAALEGYYAASSSLGAAATGAQIFSLSSRGAMKGGGGAAAGTDGTGDGGQAGAGYALNDTCNARRPSAAGPSEGARSLRGRGGAGGGYAGSAPATHTGLVVPGSLVRLPGSITGNEDDGGLADVLGCRNLNADGTAAAAGLLAPPPPPQQQQQQLLLLQQAAAAAAAAFGAGSYHPSRSPSLLQRHASGTGLGERHERAVAGPGSVSAAFRARAATVSMGGGDRQAGVPGMDGPPASPGASQRAGGTWRAAVANSTASAAAAAAASHSPQAFRAAAAAAPKAWDVDAPASREPPRALAAPSALAAGEMQAQQPRADPALEAPDLVLSAAAAKLASLALMHSDSEAEDGEV